ncbi:hypothetical protein D3C79_658010 [compost metagenome]
MHTAIGKVLRWQVGIRQRVAIMLVTLGQSLSELLQITQGDIVPNQCLIVLTQFTQRVNRTALEAHLVQYESGI